MLKVKLQHILMGLVLNMIPNEINKLIGNRYIIGNKLRIQTLNSIMCGYFYIGFIDFILNEKILTDSVGLKLFDI